MSAEHKNGHERPQPEVIGLNQIFYPFAPHITKPWRNQFCESIAVPSYKSHVALATGVVPPIPVEFRAEAMELSLRDTITPFATEEGYILDIRDFQPQQRVRRFIELTRPEFIQVDPSIAPLYINMWDDRLNKQNAEITKALVEDPDLLPEAIQLSENLRLQLLFPSVAVETKPFSTFVGQATIASRFYPLETGPLQTDSQLLEELGFYQYALQEGFYIGVPSDPLILASVKARFVLSQVRQPRS